MKIRWLQRKRKLTISMITEYSIKHSISMKRAKEELEKELMTNYVDSDPVRFFIG